MFIVNLNDLPEPVARTILAMVEAIRTRLRGRADAPPPGPMPTRHGTILGRLTREEIYADRV